MTAKESAELGRMRAERVRLERETSGDLSPSKSGHSSQSNSRRDSTKEQSSPNVRRIKEKSVSPSVGALPRHLPEPPLMNDASPSKGDTSPTKAALDRTNKDKYGGDFVTFSRWQPWKVEELGPNVINIRSAPNPHASKIGERRTADVCDNPRTMS